jgi:rhodanese-related sulfurtransferase/peroxiredoxin
MSLAARLGHLAQWRPVSPGEPTPPLSLTGDDGTWIRLVDFADHLHVVLVFFRKSEDAGRWLQDFQTAKPHFDRLSAAVFGVSTARTDTLREHRKRLGLDFLLLYDPLAVDARAFRATSRWRPVCKDTVVVVSKAGDIVWSARGQADPMDVVSVLAELSGEAAPTAASAVKDIDSARAAELLAGGEGKHLLVDVRTFSEYDADHVPGAIHMSVDELPQRYAELGQTSRIICVCQAGGRSTAAAAFLASIGGTELYSVVGGMSGWSGDRVTGGQAQ